MSEGAWGWGSGQLQGPQQSEHAWPCILGTGMLGAVTPQTGSARAAGQSACRLQLALAKVEGWCFGTQDPQPGKTQAKQEENEAHAASLVQAHWSLLLSSGLQPLPWAMKDKIPSH